MSDLAEPAPRLELSFRYRGSPTALYSGSEATAGLAREVRRASETTILVFTSPSCVQAGLHERIRDALNVDFALFAQVERESPLSSVEAARDLARKARSGLLIGLGGGSAM